MFFRFLAFILRKSFFELLYPIYLLKFKKERDYVAERLKKANLQIAPKEVYRNLFINGIDSLKYLQRRGNPPWLPFCEKTLHLCEIPKPVVFVSIHLGAFEMLHRYLATNEKINLMVSEFRNKKLDKFLNSTRKTPNLNIVKDTRILKTIIRNKEILAVMADQSRYGAEYFEILGQSVPLFLKLPLAANRLGASVVLFRTFRKNDEHMIRIEKVYEPNSNINPAEIAKIFESWILEYPEQWAWNYGIKI
ncbi:MAG: lysophospholipid acyltransferase family protein [Fibromonadales bacterium]|nr:lysophospholipid acyltransferase family protein [Fibromonadales bacterium]